MKLLTKLQLWWIQNAYPEANLTESYLANLKVLKPKDFTKIDIRQSCIYPIEGVYPRLVKYIDVINHLIYILETDQSIPQGLFNQSIETNTLDRFLLSRIEQYTNAELLVEEYKVATSNYFILFNSLKTNKPYLNRQLENFNSHLNALTLTLIRYKLNELSR